MGKLIPLILIVLGVVAGAGAGFYLRPEPVASEEGAAEAPVIPEPDDTTGLALYEFPNQFMVPLVAEGRVAATVVLQLALEYVETETAVVTANAPRLRDAMLQVMFDHANSGGFEGTFTENATLAQLRRALLESAQKTVGAKVAQRVLITELLRVGS